MEVQPYSYPHSVPAIEVETASANKPDGSTVVGVPVIPEYMPASDFLSRVTPYGQSLFPHYPHSEIYSTPLAALSSVTQQLEEETRKEGQDSKEMAIPVTSETPFAAHEVQSVDDLVASFPLSDIEMPLTERYESDEYWKRFISTGSSTNTAAHES